MNRTSQALVVSLMLHLALLLSTPVLIKFKPRIQPVTAVRSRPLQLRLERPKTTPPPPPSAVVDVNDTANIVEKTPDTARFLSDRNRAVPKETQARNTGPNAQASRPSRARPQPSEPGEGPGKLKLGLPPSFIAQDESKTQMANLSPSNYLPNIEMGNETLLNTREYAYASYYIRMKRQMEMIWNPQGVLAQGQFGRDMYVTTVTITLDSKGHVLSARILETSGDYTLDQEALRTVREGGPYLNPPSGLIEADGNIRVPRWSFIVTRKRIL